MKFLLTTSRAHEITEGPKTRKLGGDRVNINIHNSSAPQTSCMRGQIQELSKGSLEGKIEIYKLRCISERASKSNCECRRREAAIAEGMKHFATRGSGRAS